MGLLNYSQPFMLEVRPPLALTTSWTPERDGNGVVTPASWAQVPLNTWVKVNGTNMEAVLKPQLFAAQPWWASTPMGVSAWSDMFNAWTGMAWDTRAGSESGYVALMGGHGAGAMNSIQKFDVRKMQWFWEDYPDDWRNWPYNYTLYTSGTYPSLPPLITSYTQYVPARDYYVANPYNAEGVGYDEFFDTATGPSEGGGLRQNASTRRPTSRHSYGGPIFIPEMNSMVMWCRRYWRYSFDSHSWVDRRFMLNDPQPDSPGGWLPLYHVGENNYNLWDGVNGNLMCDMFKGGGGRQVLVNPMTGAMEMMNGSYGRIGYNQAYSSACLKGRSAISILNFDQPKPNYLTTRPCFYNECNLDSWNPATKTYAPFTSTPITIGPGLTEKEFVHPNDWDDNTNTYKATGPYLTREWDGQCSVYIPELNSIFSRAWSYAKGTNPLQGGSRNVLINCSTKVMTPFEPGGRWYTDDGYTWGTSQESAWNKMEYLPALHILIIHMAANSEVRIIKFA